jgi:hypothetical protein
VARLDGGELALALEERHRFHGPSLSVGCKSRVLPVETRVRRADDRRMSEPSRWIIALDRLANTTFGPLMVHSWLAARRAGPTRPSPTRASR